MRTQAIRVATPSEMTQRLALIRQMHVDRKSVFVDLLKWRIGHENGEERDRFDDGSAEYLILHDPVTMEHLASLRLLQTVGPHLMSELFPYLCVGGPPMGPHIREITRFCVAPRGRSADRRVARNQLVRTLVEYALLTGIRSFTAACEMTFLSEVLSAGWNCRPLGPPHLVEGRAVGALQIDISTHTLALLNASWTAESVPLLGVQTRHPLAA